MRPPLQRRGKLTQVVIIGHWPTFMLALVVNLLMQVMKSVGHEKFKR